MPPAEAPTTTRLFEAWSDSLVSGLIARSPDSGFGPLLSAQQASNDLGAVADLPGLGVQLAAQNVLAALDQPPAHALLEVRGFHQGAHRLPQGILQHFVHVLDQAFGGIPVTDAAAIARRVAVLDLPQGAMAFGAGEIRGRSNAVQVRGQVALVVPNLHLQLLRGS